MRSAPLLVLAAVLSAALPDRAMADEPTPILEKAIEAHGGNATLARAHAFQAKGKGTIHLGGASSPCALEIVSQFPHQYRLTGEFAAAGHVVSAVQALDGDTGWAFANGKTQALDGKALDELKAQLHVQRLRRLTPLRNDKTLRVSALPEARVHGRPALGVEVTCKGQGDVRLYFDKGTALLAKVERPAFDDTAKKEVRQEELFSDFKDVGGIQPPMRQVWRRGGKKVLDVTFTEAHYPARIAVRAFAPPDAVESALGADRDLFAHVPEVVYGRKAGMALTLDVFAPKKGANGAAIVVVSGGWVSDRESLAPFSAPFVRTLVKRGYTVFAVCHGSQPKYTIPEAIADVDRTVRFIRSHARDYSISPDRIGITGGSAGGHLSLMQGTAGGPGDKKGKGPVERASSRVQAVACFFPPTDFLNYGAKGQSAFGPGGALAVLRTAVDVRELDPKTRMQERIDAKKARELLRK